MQAQIEEFLRFSQEEKGYSDHTVAAYRNDLLQLSAYLTDEGVFSWPDVDPAHIRQYVSFLQSCGYAPASVGRKVAAIKSYFHFLVVDGVLQNDPAALVDSPQVDRRLPHPLSYAEMARLLAQVTRSDSPQGLRDRALLEVMYATGMRASEVIQLAVDDLDLEVGVVHCVGKGEMERVLPLPERAREAIRVYIKDGRHLLLKGRDEAALFVNHWGRSLTRQGLWLIVTRHAEAAGIERKVTPHTLRHSYAAHMIDRGASLRELQQRLGHTNVSSTQIYTKISD